MKKIKTQLLAIWKDESAQGMAEYALLLVVVIAIGVAFKKPILDAVGAKMEEIKSKIAGFSGTSS
jgi:Flp pilus assembly pilin Flp